MNFHRLLSSNPTDSQKINRQSSRVVLEVLHGKASFVIVQLFLFSFIWGNALAQELKLIETGTKTSLRGLSVVNDKIIWASGSRGMVALSVDGGSHFSWKQVPGYENRDFRDVEGFDGETAIIMAIDTPAILLKTNDGGKSWKKVFEDRRPGMFLDAMAFRGKWGYVIGDPVNGKAFLARTIDGGESWMELDAPELVSGEAFFASSGSNITVIALEPDKTSSNEKINSKPVFVTGGMQSRLFGFGLPIALPLRSGKNSSGANGLTLHLDGKSGVIFGGDFAAMMERDSSMLLLSIKGDQVFMKSPEQPPSGYKSHVVYLDDLHLLACGTSGVDISSDGGNNWRKISDRPFHVAGCVSGSDKVVLAGPAGTIALFFKKDLLLK